MASRPRSPPARTRYEGTTRPAEAGFVARSASQARFQPPAHPPLMAGPRTLGAGGGEPPGHDHGGVLWAARALLAGAPAWDAAWPGAPDTGGAALLPQRCADDDAAPGRARRGLS